VGRPLFLSRRVDVELEGGELYCAGHRDRTGKSLALRPRRQRPQTAKRWRAARGASRAMRTAALSGFD